ncbi:MAG: hypothetical protein PHN19_00235 [Patescibacteria group bacterium]|nr:hypothetical protein [Patescibacteria group bacterium]
MRHIYLEEDDEIISVIDKIKNVQDNNVELIFPNKSPLIRSIVNLKILKRQSDILQKNIVVVTADEIGQVLAKKAKLRIKSETENNSEEESSGIADVSKEQPIFKSYKEEEILKNIKKLKKQETPEANKPDYKEISKDSKRKQIELLKKKFSGNQKSKFVLLPSLTSKIILAFFGICIVIGAISIIFILPEAKISYSPKTEPFTHNVEASLIQGLGSPNISDKQIAYEVATIEKNSEEVTFNSTGEKDIGTKAKGQITIYNKYSSDPQPLVATTRFMGNNGRIYRLVGDVDVPGAKIEEGKTVAGRTTATIEADAFGSEYNLEAGAFAIPGLSLDKQQVIYAETSSSIIGGESKKITIITADDLKKAKEDLQAKVSQKIIEEYKTKIPNDKIIIDGAIKNEILDSKTSGEENKETKDFKMSISVKSTVPFVSKNDLQNIVFEDARKFLPENKQLLDENLDNGIKFEKISQEENKINIKVSLDKKMFTKIDEQEVKENIVGKKSQEAKDYILTNPYVYKAEVNLWPFWVNKIPRIKSKIKISEKELN